MLVTPEGNRRNQRQALLAAGLMAKAVKADSDSVPAFVGAQVVGFF